MKTRILKEEGDSLEVSLEGASSSFINALRRTAMSRVKTFAVDSVVFYDNTSSFFDEFIANRIGLVPLTTPASFEDNEEIILTLDKEGPCVIYSEDFKSTDSRVTPSIPNLPILKLSQGQVLRLEAKACVGNSLKHARHQSCVASFTVEGDDSYTLFMESYGNMPAKRILKEAVKILSEKAEAVAKGV